ncbi:MAG: sulfotransferase [Pseudomonadota bacterium]
MANLNPNFQQNVVLIGGAMRSGTTVIHRALCSAENSNPYISESWFLSDIMRLYRWNLTRYDVRHADQFGNVRNFRELIWLNIRQYLSMVSIKHNDPELLILKHPELTYYFHELSQQFNNFRFIVIVRDPRDVIASIIEVGERHKKNQISSPQTELVNIKAHCDSYISYYSDVLRNLGNYGNRLLIIKYEDFVNDPNNELQRISQFTGARYDANRAVDFLPEHASALNFNKDEREKDPFSGAFWSDAYTKPISADRIGRHKKILSAEQIEEIERRLDLFGNKFNYWLTS